MAVGGLGVSGRDGSQVSVNVATVGRIADGATVERAVATGTITDNDVITATRPNVTLLDRTLDDLVGALELPGDQPAKAPYP